jgi:DNA-binding transcriptional ArsR family regulator
MADLLPSSRDTSAAEETAPRVVGLDSDDADDLIGALSSATARRLLAALHEEPDNPASLADRADTTLQNVQYHLGKLDDAGLVEVVDTVYSEKGREMNLYAPTDRPLVVVAGTEAETTGLSSALTRLLGAASVLALASVAVQVALDGLPFGARTGGAGGDDVSTMAVEQSAPAAGGLPPGLLFFLGGLVVLALAGGYWLFRSRS